MPRKDIDVVVGNRDSVSILGDYDWWLLDDYHIENKNGSQTFYDHTLIRIALERFSSGLHIIENLHPPTRKNLPVESYASVDEINPPSQYQKYGEHINRVIGFSMGKGLYIGRLVSTDDRDATFDNIIRMPYDESDKYQLYSQSDMEYELEKDFPHVLAEIKSLTCAHAETEEQRRIIDNLTANMFRIISPEEFHKIANPDNFCVGNAESQKRLSQLVTEILSERCLIFDGKMVTGENLTQYHRLIRRGALGIIPGYLGTAHITGFYFTIQATE